MSARFLRPGRVVRVRDPGSGADWGWGAVVAIGRVSGGEGRGGENGAADPTRDDAPESYAADVVLHLSPSSKETDPSGAVSTLAPAERRGGGGEGGGGGGRLEKGAFAAVVPVSFAFLSAIYAYRLKLPSNLRDPSELAAVGKAVEELRARLGANAETLDPIADMRMDDPPGFAERWDELRRVREAVHAHPMHLGARAELRAKSLRQWETLERLRAERDELMGRIKRTELSKFRDELRSRSRVLIRLGHVDENLVVRRKGRAACEIDTSDELLVTELMFDGAFAKLDHHQLVALCACFVPVEKSKQRPDRPEEVKKALEAPLRRLRETARRIGEAQKAEGIAIDVDEYAESFEETLVDVVYAWSKGAAFDDVMRRTDLFEGTAIRAMRRLDELMMELHRAAVAVGDRDMADTFERGALSIRRGVVFAQSLYL